MSGLSVSKEHYIKTIYYLTKKGNGTRITDIASALCVTKASVCRAVKALGKAGLIVRSDNHLVYLSSEGKVAPADPIQVVKVIFMRIDYTQSSNIGSIYF